MRKKMFGYGALAVLAALGLAGATVSGGEAGKAQLKAGAAAVRYSVINPSRGIAARYPGDQGIEADSAVVFHETFEQQNIADLSRDWTDISNKDNRILSFVADSPPGSTGRHCLRMTATKGHDTGGHLWKLLDPGYDKLYARFYVKFAIDAPYVHHFVHMGAQRASPPYPVGGAGSRPSGNVSFSTGIDLGLQDTAAPPGAWFLYSYWCEMRSYETPEGTGTHFFGNPFAPAEPEQAPRDEWQCIEFMIKCNSAPDKHDGEEAYWVNGRLVGRFAPGTPEGTWLRDAFHTSGPYNTDPKPFEGFRWRTADDLKINWFWLLYYMSSVFENDIRPADPNILYNSQKGQVMFDDVVLATDYIGPFATEAPDSGQSRCDFNGDGQATVADVIQLLINSRLDSLTGQVDYNGDGRFTITDAVALLIDIMTGNCYTQ